MTEQGRSRIALWRSVRLLLEEITDAHFSSNDGYCDECDDQWPCMWIKMADDVYEESRDRYAKKQETPRETPRPRRRRGGPRPPPPPSLKLPTSASIDQYLDRMAERAPEEKAPKFRRLVDRMR